MHRTIKTTLLSSEDIARDTKKFSFRAESDISFSAGEFVLLCVDEKTVRAYSIASSPQILPIFDLIVKSVPNGRATEQFLWKKKAGDEVFFKEPMGHFSLPENVASLLLVATGTGFAPMRAFLMDRFARKKKEPLHLLFGVREKSYLFCQEELKKWANEYPFFTYTLCFSRGMVSENIFSGRVTDAARALPPHIWRGVSVALCGSKEMVTEMKKISEHRGVKKEHIKSEAW